MAHRTASTPLDADNKFGSLPAVHSDWHSGVADFHLGTGHTAPTSDAGYTTASELLSANLLIHCQQIPAQLECPSLGPRAPLPPQIRMEHQDQAGDVEPWV
jgi:hypothetical protein